MCFSYLSNKTKEINPKTDFFVSGRKDNKTSFLPWENIKTFQGQNKVFGTFFSIRWR